MSDKSDGFPSISGYDAWIESGRTKDACFELIIALDHPSEKKLNNGFWLEFTAPNGDFIGWMQFTHLINIKNRALFAAAEWRQAGDLVPAQQDVLLSSLVPQKKGHGYEEALRAGASTPVNFNVIPVDVAIR